MIVVALRKESDLGGAPTSFLQSDFWGEFKSEYGWTPIRLELMTEEKQVPFLLLVRRLRAGLSFAYVPHGPDVDIPAADRARFLAELSDALRRFVPRYCIFIRYDPTWYEAEPIAQESAQAPRPAGTDVCRPLIGAPLKRAAADVQPPDTVFVDLDRSEDAILAGMKPKWRYNVRLAEKKGVTVSDEGLSAVPQFYDLYRETSLRDRIALHPMAYYSRLFSLASEQKAADIARTPDLRLWVARYEGRALAAIVSLFLGDTAVYLYGASSDQDRNLMPSYALQWAAMRAAKSAGCVRYDLFGIPPTDDPAHPMAGLYRFKTGFGGEIVHRAGSWDFPLRPFEYASFRAAERARAWWFKDFKKRLRKSAGSEKAAGIRSGNAAAAD